MEIIYQVSEDDFTSSSWLAMRKGSISQSFRFYYFVGFAILFFAMSLIPLFKDRDYASIWGALFGLAFFYFVVFSRTAQFRRQYRRSTLLPLRNTLYIDNSSLHFVTAESELRANWKAYSRFSENSKTFILFQGDGTFVSIPKRELTPTQITELRSLFETHLPHK
jgi:YcxB-like protein